MDIEGIDEIIIFARYLHRFSIYNDTNRTIVKGFSKASGSTSVDNDRVSLIALRVVVKNDIFSAIQLINRVKQSVTAVAKADGVSSRTSTYKIISSTAVNPVITGTSTDEVVQAGTDDKVIAGAGVNIEIDISREARSDFFNSDLFASRVSCDKLAGINIRIDTCIGAGDIHRLRSGITGWIYIFRDDTGSAKIGNLNIGWTIKI